MEALVLDIKGIKGMIERAVLQIDPKLIVINRDDDDDDTALTVYPPKSYHNDYGLDVFISGAGIEMYMDGFRMHRMKLNVEAGDVAAHIKQIMEEVEAESQL